MCSSGAVSTSSRMARGDRGKGRITSEARATIAVPIVCSSPLTDRQEDFRVIGMVFDGDEVDVDTVFHGYVPDLERIDFTPNPRFLKTVEGDYNVIDVSDAVVHVELNEASPNFSGRNFPMSPRRRPSTASGSSTRACSSAGSWCASFVPRPWEASTCKTTTSRTSSR